MGLLLAVNLRCWRSILRIWGFTKRLGSFLTFRLSTTLWLASKDRLVLLKLPKSTLGKRSARRNGWATGRKGRYDKPRHTTRFLMHIFCLKLSVLLCRKLEKERFLRGRTHAKLWLKRTSKGAKGSEEPRNVENKRRGIKDWPYASHCGWNRKYRAVLKDIQ